MFTLVAIDRLWIIFLDTPIYSRGKCFRICMTYRGHIRSSGWAAALKMLPYTTQIKPRRLSPRSALSLLTSHPTHFLALHGWNHFDNSLTAPNTSMVQRSESNRLPKANHSHSGLNFFNPVNETYLEVGNGLDQCVLEANAAHNAMGDSLYLFEIGNEVDGKSLNS